MRHVGCDFAALVPPRRIHLVAAEVDEWIGENVGQLTDQGVDRVLERRIDGIEHRFMGAEPAARRHRRAPRPPFGMGTQPTGRMAGHVEFGDDSNAAVGRRRHQRAQLASAVAFGAGQLGVGAALEAEALIVG